MLMDTCVAKINYISINWDGNVTLKLDKAIDANGNYQLRINAASFGNDDWYYDDMTAGRCNPDLFYEFTIKNAPTEITNCVSNPANGSEVESLSIIELTFPDEEEVLKGDSSLTAELKNENGEIVAEIPAYWPDYVEDRPNTLSISLTEPITTPGTYTITFPVGYFSFDWWERDSSEITLSWIVKKPESGVQSIENENIRENKIYDLSGRCVGTTPDTQLSPGLYIINGRKILIKQTLVVI